MPDGRADHEPIGDPTESTDFELYPDNDPIDTTQDLQREVDEPRY